MSNEEQDAFTYNTLRNFEDVVELMGYEWVAKQLADNVEATIDDYYLTKHETFSDAAG